MLSEHLNERQITDRFYVEHIFPVMIALIAFGLLLTVSAKEVRLTIEGRFFCENNPELPVFVEMKERDSTFSRVVTINEDGQALLS